MRIRIIFASGLFVGIAAALSAQPDVPTPRAPTPTPQAASPSADGSPEWAGSPGSSAPPARTPSRSGFSDPPPQVDGQSPSAPTSAGVTQSSQSGHDSSVTKKTATAPPAQLSDCANDGWRTYSGPAYKSQRACEKWVQKHVLRKTGEAAPTPASASSSRVAPTPVPRN